MAANIAELQVDPPTLKDDHFYFTFITFQVEGILFRVPRHPFETESEVFKDMFGLPSPTDTSVDGSSDEKPLVLQGISVKNFRAFLRVLFDTAHGPQCDLSQEEWISVLHSAHMWNCNRLFALAVTKLDGLDVNPVSKVTLANAYNITDWLQTAYFSLATRPEPLTLKEAEELGMDCVLKLNEVRELRYRWIIDDLGPSQDGPEPFEQPTNTFLQPKSMFGQSSPSGQFGSVFGQSASSSEQFGSAFGHPGSLFGSTSGRPASEVNPPSVTSRKKKLPKAISPSLRIGNVVRCNTIIVSLDADRLNFILVLDFLVNVIDRNTGNCVNVDAYRQLLQIF